MKKENLKIKEDITFSDIESAIEMVANGVFVDDENLGEYGYLRYVPYVFKKVMYLAVVTYIFEGVEFDADDNIFKCIYDDKELMELYNTFVTKNEDIFNYINDMSIELIDYRKQEVISINTAIYSSLLKTVESNPIEDKIKEIVDKELEKIDIDVKKSKAEEKLLEQQAKQVEYSNKISENLTPEQNAEYIKKVLNGDFDSEQFARMFVKEYLDSFSKNNVKSMSGHKVKRKSNMKQISTKKEE